MSPIPSIISTDALANLLAPVELYLVSSEELYTFLTDSRSLASPQGTAFLAMRTASGDGHRYIDELYRSGVRTFIVESPIADFRKTYPQANFLRVSSTLTALQTIATAHREHFTLPIIGITGSNGKTIVKEYLNALLSPDYNVCRSPRSYNSQIGVPLSVLQLTEENDLAIFEAGISQPREMERLERIIRPTIGVLTSIGSAHAEHFPSREALLVEKLQLFSKVQTLIAPLDIEGLEDVFAQQRIQARTIGWSRTSPEALLYIQSEQRGSSDTLITAQLLGREIELWIPFADSASIDNILTALCTIYAIEGEISPSIIERLKHLTPVDMRLEIKESHQGNTLINDAYSNDLDALPIALDVLRRRASAVGAKSVAILSDIEQSALPREILYRQVAQSLEEFDVQQVYAVGKQIEYIRECSSRFELFTYATTEALLSSGHLQALEQSCILIKGARRFGFEQIYRELSRLEHQTTLEVNLSAIRYNLTHYRSLLPPSHRIVCMIKANGYGMGDFELARTLEDARVDYLAVATADEAKALRRRGIKSHIMVMNPDRASVDTLMRYALEPEVYSIDLLKRIIARAEHLDLREFPLHLKIDSGMHRLGLSLDELPEALERLKATKAVRLLSVFSHLASADEAEQDNFTQAQANYLQQAYSIICRELGYCPLLHLLNTSGIARFADRYAFDMVRLGIGLYGVNPVTDEHPLRPVCRLSTTILQVKTLSAGEPIGYGGTQVFDTPRRIAIIPIGYADGLRRSLGRGGWSVLVRGKLCPIVGNICMDACMIDVSEIAELVQAGDRVVIFGGDGLSVEDMAKRLDTIAYEVLTTLSPRIQRLYLQD